MQPKVLDRWRRDNAVSAGHLNQVVDLAIAAQKMLPGTAELPTEGAQPSWIAKVTSVGAGLGKYVAKLYTGFLTTAATTGDLAMPEGLKLVDEEVLLLNIVEGNIAYGRGLAVNDWVECTVRNGWDSSGRRICSTRGFSRSATLYGKATATWTSGNTVTLTPCKGDGTVTGESNIIAYIVAPTDGSPNVPSITIGKVYPYASGADGANWLLPVRQGPICNATSSVTLGGGEEGPEGTQSVTLSSSVDGTIWLSTRDTYFDAGDKTLYGYRIAAYRDACGYLKVPNGTLAETRYIIDVPTECEADAVASTAITGLTGSSVAVTDSSGKLTTDIKLPIVLGGTNETSQTTNGIVYYDGSGLTTGSNLTWDGTKLSVHGGIDMSGASNYAVLITAPGGAIQFGSSSGPFVAQADVGSPSIYTRLGTSGTSSVQRDDSTTVMTMDSWGNLTTHWGSKFTNNLDTTNYIMTHDGNGWMILQSYAILLSLVANLLQINGLPTSSAGLAANQVYRDGNFLKIV